MYPLPGHSWGLHHIAQNMVGIKVSVMISVGILTPFLTGSWQSSISFHHAMSPQHHDTVLTAGWRVAKTNTTKARSKGIHKLKCRSDLRQTPENNPKLIDTSYRKKFWKQPEQSIRQKRGMITLENMSCSKYYLACLQHIEWLANTQYKL